jgi:hypothetical protein
MSILSRFFNAAMATQVVFQQPANGDHLHPSWLQPLGLAAVAQHICNARPA